MKLKKIRIINEENGDTMLIFALFLVIILGMAGIVMDFGRVYETRSVLKKTADAAVLSGAQELTNGNDSVNQVVSDILKADNEEGTLKQLNIYTDNIYKLNVVLEKDVQMYFLRLFSIKSLKVTVSSSSELLPMSRAAGAVPLGIDESIPLQYMQEYSLKVDSGDSQYGNFGVLALSGTGASLYENDLQYGFNGEIKVGDIIDTQTGNIAGKTQEAVNARIDSCPYPVDDISHRDNPRIILILIYKPYEITTNQVKSVKITGFAYFYIKSPMSSTDTSIDGYFIKRAGTGYGDDSADVKGAYAIKLTE